jgi:hypothetical protein
MPAQLAPQSPPPTLPSPPLAERLLLENPVPAVLVALAAGFIAMWMLRRAGRKRTNLAAAGAGVALAAVAFAVGRMVETPREALKARTRALVEAVAEADSAALDDLLDRSVQVTLSGGGIRLGNLDKREIIARAEDYMRGSYAVESWSVPTLQAAADGPEVGRTLLRVVVTPEATRFPTGSWWAIDWERIGGAWRAVEIELLRVNRGP